MPTVLVLDGGSGPALAAVRSLGRGGWRVLVSEGTRSAASKYAAGTVDIPPADHQPDRFTEAVAAALGRQQVDVIVPCIDASVELLWAHEDLLGETRVLGGSRESARLGLDKVETLVAADRAGFPTAAWCAPATVAEAVAALDRTGLPAVVKPRRSYLRADGRLLQRRHSFVWTFAELEPVLLGLAEPDGALPLVQAFVPGRSLSVSAVLRQGRVLASVARETLSFSPIPGGTSVWKRTVPLDDVGVVEALELLRAVEYEGLAEVEYQVDGSGSPRLMEIGVRVHGWIPLAVHAGADLPLVGARALLGEEPDEPVRGRAGVEMRWPKGEVDRLRTALSREPNLPPGTTRRRVVAALWPPWRPGMAYDGIHFDDLGPWTPALLKRGRRRRAAP